MRQAFVLGHRSVPRITLLLLAWLAVSGPVAAADHDAPAADTPRALPTPTVRYPDFRYLSALTRVGSTKRALTADGYVLRLVTDQADTAGAAYLTQPVTLGANGSFSTSFQFRVTSASGFPWADGFTFFLAQSPAGVGQKKTNYGGYLGYKGVLNSVAVEFDEFFDSEFDAEPNQVAIDLDGDVDTAKHSPQSLGQPYGQGTACRVNGQQPLFCLADGNIWSVRIAYDGNIMTVWLYDGNNAVIKLIPRYKVNVLAALGGSTAFIGFSAGTGSYYSNIDVLDWVFASQP